MKTIEIRALIDRIVVDAADARIDDAAFRRRARRTALSLSRALAATISPVRASSASAMACSAASLAPLSSADSRRAAARAATQTSVTDRSATAMRTQG